MNSIWAVSRIDVGQVSLNLLSQQTSSTNIRLPVHYPVQGKAQNRFRRILKQMSSQVLFNNFSGVGYSEHCQNDHSKCFLNQ